jgi:RHS repeat-associated protein
MKTSINILNYLIFVGLLFASCKTKIQTNNSTATTFIEPKKVTVIDTIFSTYGLSPIINQPKPIPKIYTSQQQYEMAFIELKNMLEGKSEPNFERAVFISENPHHNSKFTYRAFQNSVTEQLQVIQNLIKANDKSDSMEFGAKVNEYGRFKLADIRYLPKEKKELYRKALSNWAIFKYLTDTVFVYVAKDSSLFGFYHAPYSYATADPFGMKNWSNSQVMNLLISEKNQGNCFALTALYKILSDRLNADARLCTAPQHIYIQHKDPKGQYYNVELATAGHPGDGIIQTLTYTPSEAIISGIALRDYDTKQSIGLCLVNLAKSYEHKFKTKDNEFMLRCAEVALAHDSLNLNALLLKQQVLDARVTKYASKHRLNNITLLKKDTAIKATVSKLEKHTTLLNRLGHRQMPTDMQEMILNQFQSEPNHWNHKTRNPKPFTSIKVQDPKDEEYWTLTAGMFQEVFEPKIKETYGHYTLNTNTGKIINIDTNKLKGFIIDPVAFAYDFGARMYDARVGRWLSLDPLQSKYPNLSPYNFVANNPILYIDPDGKKIVISGNQKFVSLVQQDLAKLLTTEKGRAILAVLSASKIEYKISEINFIHAVANGKGIAYLSNPALASDYDEDYNTLNYSPEQDDFNRGGNKFTSYLILGHELYHAYQDETKQIGFDKEHEVTNRGFLEGGAVGFENYLRDALGVAGGHRTKYENTPDFRLQVFPTIERIDLKSISFTITPPLLLSTDKPNKTKDNTTVNQLISVGDSQMNVNYSNNQTKGTCYVNYELEQE